MNRIVLGVSIRVRSPFLFPGLAAGNFGFDAVPLRDREERPLIPQDQVRGVLRHAAREVVAASGGSALSEGDFALLFGQGSGDAAAFDPDQPAAGGFEPVNRSRMLFADLRSELRDVGRQGFRVRLDETTGAADPGGLQVVELVAPHGAEVTFDGEAVLFATDQQAARWLPALRAATGWVSAIGANKTAGFGEVLGFEIVERSRSPVLAPATVPMGQETRRYRVSIDRPFLVAARREAPNVYAGSETIPGGAIKGALAWKLALAGHGPEQDEALTRLAVSHARVEGMPDPLALSLIVATPPEDAGARIVADVLVEPSAGRGLLRGGVPRYQSDWKEADRQAVLAHLGVRDGCRPARTARMHVAIDPATGAASDQQLYVADAVEPDGRCWLLDVDYSGIADAGDRARLAAALEAGLDGVGRTGARLSLEPCKMQPAPGSARPVRGRTDRFAVLLLTDGVLAGPGDGPDAQAAYEAYWSRVCPGARLVDFRASQRLAGGYVGLRFGRRPGFYAPFWLTEAGSVFLLEGDVAATLDGLVRTGLPAPMIDGVSTDWRSCPYQPENGYGRIRADHGADDAAGDAR